MIIASQATFWAASPSSHAPAVPGGHTDVPNKRCVRVAEGGRVLQAVELDRGFACALGGPCRTTLFIVAAHWQGMTESEMVAPGSSQVLAIDVDVPGAGWP